MAEKEPRKLPTQDVIREECYDARNDRTALTGILSNFGVSDIYLKDTDLNGKSPEEVLEMVNLAIEHARFQGRFEVYLHVSRGVEVPETPIISKYVFDYEGI